LSLLLKNDCYNVNADFFAPFVTFRRCLLCFLLCSKSYKFFFGFGHADMLRI